MKYLTLPNKVHIETVTKSFPLYFNYIPSEQPFFNNLIMDDILPEDSVSSLSSCSSLSTSLSAHFTPALSNHHIPEGIDTLDKCIIIREDPEYLSKLEPFLNKASFLQS